MKHILGHILMVSIGRDTGFLAPSPWYRQINFRLVFPVSKMKNFPLTNTFVFVSCFPQAIFGVHSNLKWDFAQAC